MITIELPDVQGFLIRGYKRMPFSRYLVLQITDAAQAKAWLHSISTSITNAMHVPETTCLNIGFTNPGLLALGMDPKNAESFSKEFREGMVTPHRQRILGDYDDSACDNWRWGGTKNERVDILLMIFGATQEMLDEYHKTLTTQVTGSGMKILEVLDSKRIDADKEHFGFRDGIAQPYIAGSDVTGPEDNTIATGEFLMGYKNEYKVFPQSPLITVEQGNVNLLAADAAGSGMKDLGRNGSYLVFRQMEQHVDKFWTFMNERTQNEDGTPNPEESTKLASKMMGRWPSGAPLVKFPDKDPGILSDDDDFGFANDDKDGFKCPFGSHIRRCNPRDTFEDNKPKKSIHLTKKHRIIRRGRQYGTPLASSPVNFNPEGEVGLHFICFNTDISRQFEFIQYTWANFPRFQQLANDPDPIIGVRQKPEEDGHKESQVFTIQQPPVSKCITDLQRFVTIKGGGYFFYPSITAIRYLATI